MPPTTSLASAPARGALVHTRATSTAAAVPSTAAPTQPAAVEARIERCHHASGADGRDDDDEARGRRTDAR